MLFLLFRNCERTENLFLNYASCFTYGASGFLVGSLMVDLIVQSSPSYKIIRDHIMRSVAEVECKE